MVYDKVLLDADFCLKLGCSAKYPYLLQLLPQLANEIYIHEVVNQEIKTGRQQLDKLIKDELVKIFYIVELTKQERLIYDATYSKLERIMMNPKTPNKNRGEVSTLALAKTRGIPYFFTDENNLQPIVDTNLNTGINDVHCIRIIDVIKLMREKKICGFNRKDAKLIWVMSGKNKTDFDRDIWPDK